jgi:hypothetical protein
MDRVLLKLDVKWDMSETLKSGTMDGHSTVFTIYKQAPYENVEDLLVWFYLKLSNVEVCTREINGNPSQTAKMEMGWT